MKCKDYAGCGAASGRASSGGCITAAGRHTGQQLPQYQPWTSSGMCKRAGQFRQMSQHPLTRSDMWQSDLMRALWSK
jgi:hypothetical protein